MDISEELRYQREKIGKSQNKVAKETGIKQQMLNYWENGKGAPNLEFCIILADYYGVSLDELVGREFGHCDNVNAQAVQINNGGNNTQNNFFGANNRERGNGITNK